ncbi:MAG: 3-phosphoshikimate 1-carboxyvinyltransferase [Syntrophales bacterium]
METIEIKPLPHRPDATVIMPGSKSHTQRALILAAIAAGKSILQNTLMSEDTSYLIAALKSLGTDISSRDGDLYIVGVGGRLADPGKELYLGNNGTAMRILTGLVAIGPGTFTLTGGERLRERPLEPLMEALRKLGVDARGRDREGYPPVIVRTSGLRGGKVSLRDIESSQYVSALLISAPYGAGDTHIELVGRIPSLPYVSMTIAAMKEFGVEVETTAPCRYRVKGSQCYRGVSCRIEGDVSSASYFFLAAALCQGKIRVENINPHSLQGDIGFLSLLEDSGCFVNWQENGVELTGRTLPGGDLVFDLKDMPDMVPTLAILSALRPGRTVIANVAHLRLKESDRLAAVATELRKTGIQVEERPDSLVITGGQPQAAEIETYNDHRIAMSFAILGLAVPGMIIKNPGCVDKSFPDFWKELDKLYQK